MLWCNLFPLQGGVHRQCTDPGPVVVSFFYLVHLKIKLVQGTRLGVGIWNFSLVPVKNWYQVLIWIQFLQNWIFVIDYSVYYDPPHCWCMYPNDDTIYDIHVGLLLRWFYQVVIPHLIIFDMSLIPLGMSFNISTVTNFKYRSTCPVCLLIKVLPLKKYNYNISVEENRPTASSNTSVLKKICFICREKLPHVLSCWYSY